MTLKKIHSASLKEATVVMTQHRIQLQLGMDMVQLLEMLEPVTETERVMETKQPLREPKLKDTEQEQTLMLTRQLELEPEMRPAVTMAKLLEQLARELEQVQGRPEFTDTKKDCAKKIAQSFLVIT